ncbi:hypothetical protein [Aureispira sp. CCB-QB1]|uniref:hypothetical protein n=1 Tax=Aureispira sp. CCB-QB1 TaxID=1313421 RepID=UPI000698AE92|nr:hypothetical protein [Aureispira sp. CCB-QB1]
MNKSTIHIIASSLKNLLVLFPPDAELTGILLGDTRHPSHGFVDEKILDTKNKILDLLEFGYDFKGLVAFEANLQSLKIQLLGYTQEHQEYLVQGTAKEIQALQNKIIEENAWQPNKYTFDAHIVW